MDSVAIHIYHLLSLLLFDGSLLGQFMRLRPIALRIVLGGLSSCLHLLLLYFRDRLYSVQVVTLLGALGTEEVLGVEFVMHRFFHLVDHDELIAELMLKEIRITALELTGL